MAAPARPARWWALLLLLALLAGACSVLDDDADPEADTGPTLPEASTLLRVASGEWTDCLHPLLCDDDTARTLVLEHVLPRLMDVHDDGGYVPSTVLAEGPEVSVDDDTGEQTVRFVLNPDARWHDGRPITSSDVTATWLAHLRTPGAEGRGHELITGVDDHDPLVAEVTLSRPFADWPELFGGHRGWLLQADALGGDADTSDLWRDAVPFGAGPFELVSFDDRSVVLVARPEHWDPSRQAGVDQVRIEHVEGVGDDEGSMPGGIDVVLPATVGDELPEGYGMRQGRSTSIVGLMLDRRTPALASAGVRAAIASVLDREDLVDLTVGSWEPPDVVTCAGFLPQDGACDDALAPAEPEPDAARFLLELDGWTPDPATGARSRPDQALSTPVTFDPAIRGAREIAEEVAARLRAVGFATEIRAVDAATWADRNRTAGTGVGIQAVPLGTVGRLADLHGCRDGEVNPLGWCEPSVQALVRELGRTLVADERGRLATALSQAAAEAWAWLPLHQVTDVWLFDGNRVAIPSVRPPGTGPLGALHEFERLDP